MNIKPNLWTGLVCCRFLRMIALFDMVNDPTEQNDISAIEPEMANRLYQAYLEWFDEVTDSRNMNKVAIQIGYHEAPEVELPATCAVPRGNASFCGKGYELDWVVGMASPDDQLIWELDELTIDFK